MNTVAHLSLTERLAIALDNASRISAATNQELDQQARSLQSRRERLMRPATVQSMSERQLRTASEALALDAAMTKARYALRTSTLDEIAALGVVCASCPSEEMVTKIERLLESFSF